MDGETSTPEGTFLQLNGLRLHHLDWGEPTGGGEAIVLLHGIRLHAHCWSDFARRFCRDYHVLALDARGHGDSDWARDGDYHLHTYYEDLLAVLDARGLERVHLIGHSLGARTCMLFTHLQPERVQRLVLVDMGAGLPRRTAGKDFSRMTETPPPQDFESYGQATDYLAAILARAPREMIDESVVHGMRELENGRHTWKYDPALGGAPQPRPGVREWDLWEAVRTIACPTLLLHGEHSQVVTAEIAARTAAEMADCRTQEVATAGHALFTEQPALFAESVGSFLRES